MTKSQSIVFSGLFVLLAALSAVPVSAADDAAAKAKFEQAKALYEGRQDLAKVDQAIQVLAQAEGLAADAELKYDILILHARSLYWKGQHQKSDDAKKPVFLAAKDKADAARRLTDDYSEAPYYAGISLARWAEANGVVESIQRKGELIKYMNDAKDAARSTRDGAGGEEIDGYGPARVLGRMYHKLPAMLGGDRAESLKYLRLAVAKADNYVLNVLYLVDTLSKGGAAERAESSKLLNELLARDINSFAKDRQPETLEELQLARDYQNGKPLP